MAREAVADAPAHYEETVMRDRPIVISEPQIARLRGLIPPGPGQGRDHQHLLELEAELDRAVVLEPDEMPADVITLGARVGVRDMASGERREMTLVLPKQADVRNQRLSVLAPLGTALLGYREGDEIEWVMPGGLKRLGIEWVRQRNVLPSAEGVVS
jgi:regulator of nucleoside diphosphate kinase